MKTFKEFATNKDFYRSVMNRNTVTGIDIDQFPNREKEGLEGPFKFKNGRVLYYDKKEGKYYDSRTDLFVEPEEMNGLMP
jgi:hypothetical protein